MARVCIRQLCEGLMTNHIFIRSQASIQLVNVHLSYPNKKNPQFKTCTNMHQSANANTYHLPLYSNIQTGHNVTKVYSHMFPFTVFLFIDIFLMILQYVLTPQLAGTCPFIKLIFIFNWHYTVHGKACRCAYSWDKFSSV